MPYGKRKTTYQKRTSKRGRPTRRTYRRSYRGRRGRINRAHKRYYSKTIYRGLYSTDRAIAKLVYTSWNYTNEYQDILRTSITTGGTISIFNGNNSYTPDSVALGGAPTGFADLARRYNKYIVMGSSISLRSMDDPVTGTAKPYAITLVPRKTTSTLSLAYLNNIKEVPWAKQKIIEPSNSNPLSSASLKSYMSTNKIFAINKAEVKNGDNYYGSTSGTFDPADRWYWHIYYHLPWDPTDTGTTKLNTRYFVKITYYIQFLDRNDIPAI